MDIKRNLETGVALIKSALNHVASRSERGSVDACVDTLQELAILIDDLPEAVMNACSPDDCANCHHYKAISDPLPYGERTVYRQNYECLADSPNDCPAVRRAGLGPDCDISIPAFLQKQAS